MCLFTFVFVCNFNQALDLKEEVVTMLEELLHKQSMHGENTLKIESHTKVLALIRKDSRYESVIPYNFCLEFCW